MIKAKFIISAAKLEQCPDFGIKEIALLGRSNVGKSTFINSLARNNKLAKTSNTPGKTRLINLFNFDEKFIIADLPGYGYAKVSKTIQAQWQKELENYLLNRKNLKLLIQFIDARHEIQKNDYQMREWVNSHNLPIITIASKIDYVGKSKMSSVVSYLVNELNTPTFPFSKDNTKYADNILDYLIKL